MQLARRIGLLLLLLAGLGWIGAKQPAASQSPLESRPANIILILADDVGVEAFAAYGGPHEMPSLDRLIRRGVTFEHAFSTPLCSPSRTRLMTARENAKNYEAFAYLDPDERTFGNLFADAGYATGIVGKWQLGGNAFDDLVGITPEQAGFREALTWQLHTGPRKGSRYWGPTLWRNGQAIIREEGFGPDVLNENALSFIDRHRDEPFFLYYTMVLVHDPFVPTPDQREVEGTEARFAAMMAYMDKMVGRVLDRLEANGLDQNTLVIFTSDNGTNRTIVSLRNGTLVRGGKGLPTLTGTHVPMIVSWPGRLPEGERSEALFDFRDILPTLAEAVGQPAPQGIDGVSQLPVLTGEKRQVRETIYQHYAPVWLHPPTRFAFNTTRKLYADGRYVALDMAHDEERELEPQSLSAADRRTRQDLQRVLDSDPVPVNPVRYPWCKGQEPREPGGDPTIVGCASSPSGD